MTLPKGPAAQTKGQAFARNEIPEDLGAALRDARLPRGSGRNEAGRRLGIAPGYVTMLEQGKRCPSVAMAEHLIEGLDLDSETAGALLEVARPGVGHSRPELSFGGGGSSDREA